jgi:translation initiation factor IF-3
LRKYYRTNQFIRHPEVRVISEKGEQVGVMSSEKALSLAKEQGLDLVEISDKAKPPIVKIIAFTKLKYLESKKDKLGQGKSTQNTKEVRFSPFMAENDLNTKVNRAVKFLKSGDRVKIVVKFTGRQITKKDFGDRVMQYALSKLEDVASIDQQPKLIGKLLVAQIKPKK